MQQEIVQLYSENRCAAARSKVRPYQYDSLRPNVLAVFAFCEPPGNVAESLFAKAETLDPTGDLIVLLHAKYRWKKNHTSAEPLFRKVLMLARHPYIRFMASEYLAGRIDKDEPISLSPYTLYGSLMLGGGQESNPRWPDLTAIQVPKSGASNIRLNLSAQRWVQWGSLAAIYTLTDNEYFSAHQSDLMFHEVELRSAIRVGPQEDIVFRLLGSYATLGSSRLLATQGIGILGVVYRPLYKQSVQGLIFRDRLYPSALTAQEGVHFRFEYSWEFFPGSWNLKSLISIEHVDAQNNAISVGIPNAHTDLGLALGLQYDFKLFVLGFNPKVTYRKDSSTSNYTSPSDGSPVAKNRADTLLTFQPILTVPIVPYLNFMAWYQWERVFSNIGPSDYTDRNYLNQSVAAAVKIFLSSY